MGALADLRGDIATALGKACVGHDDWTVLALPVDAVSPPAFVIEHSEPWVPQQRVTACRFEAVLDVRCVAGRVEPDPGFELIELMVEGALRELDAAGFPTRGVSKPRPWPLGNVTYLAALITTAATVALT